MRAIALRNGTFEETHAISAIVSSTTQNKRKDISKFADVLSSCVRKSRDSSLSTHPGVEFVFAEIASTSQTIRTSFFYDACVGLVQWSISNREDSHPGF